MLFFSAKPYIRHVGMKIVQYCMCTIHSFVKCKYFLFTRCFYEIKGTANDSSICYDLPLFRWNFFFLVQ
jgi:hypothetical protein